MKQNISDAIQILTKILGEYERNSHDPEYVKSFEKGYPFTESLDEVILKMIEWRENALVK